MLLYKIHILFKEIQYQLYALVDNNSEAALARIILATKASNLEYYYTTDLNIGPLQILVTFQLMAANSTVIV